MTSPKYTYDLPPDLPSSVVREDQIEYGFIGRLQRLKYEYRSDITDRTTLEANFREKFEDLNRVRLPDGEFSRLLDEIVTPDVFRRSRTRTGRQRSRAGEENDLGWKARTQAELALMADLHPLLTKRAGGRDISGLSAYEQ